MLDFFQLREQPFGVTPDPRYLYLGRGHREALASLAWGIHAGRGFLGLVAPPGMGKTTLLFELLQRTRGSAQTALLFHTQCTSRELMRYLLADLGLLHGDPDMVEMHEIFNQALVRAHHAGRQVIVVVDEAQNLSDEVLETVRLLSDFETSRSKLLQIVLSGQMQLGTRLACPELAQLRQRISLMCRLRPFSREETEEYIRHRLRVAGHAGGFPFNAEAVARIAMLSQGIPRNINNFCFNAMSLACALQRLPIDRGMVDEVAQDLEWTSGKNEALDSESSPPPASSDSAAPLEPQAPEARAAAAPAAAVRPEPLPPARIAGTAAAPAPLPASHVQPASQVARTSPRPPAPRQAAHPAARPGRLERHPWFVATLIVGTLLLLIGLAGSVVSSTEASTPAPAGPASQASRKSEPPPQQGIVFPIRRPFQPEAAAPAPESPAPQPLLSEPVNRPRRPKASSANPVIEESPIVIRHYRLRSAKPAEGRIEPPAIAVQISPAVLGQILAPAGRYTQPGIAPPVAPDIRPPVPIKQVKPAYPAAARYAGVEGDVVLSAWIGPDGRVTHIEVHGGDPLLWQAAVEAVKRWRYQPQLVDGRPSQARTEIVIRFKL